MDELKDLGLELRESDNPERMTIDFSVCDKADDVAWVWGKPGDIEWECDHTEIEFEDDETVGECMLCGATCGWHREVDWDNGVVLNERVPHAWHRPKELGGILSKIIKEKYGG